MKSGEKSVVVLEKSQLDELPFFSKTLPTRNLHQTKQDLKMLPNFHVKSSALKRCHPLMPVQDYSSIESAKKIYRVPSNRDQGQNNLGASSDANDALSRGEPPACPSSSVSKPQPPSAVTLKYNSNVLLKPRRTPQTVASRTRKERKNTRESNFKDESGRKRVYESNVQATKVHNKQDVLASLKQLSLLEPFLGSTCKDFSSDGGKSTMVPLPLEGTKLNGLSGFSNCAAGAKNVSKPFQKKDSSNSWKPSQVTREIKQFNEKSNEMTLPTTKSNCPSSHSQNGDNDMLYIVNGNVGFNSSQEDYIDTSDNESFVYRDAYNNKISIKEEVKVKPRHETPLSIVTSLNQPSKPPNKRQSYLTQRQLSFVGASLPTATVVDISTGSVVEDGTATGETQIEEHVQRLRSSAGSRANVPVSFYHNRKIKRRKQEDRAEMMEIHKLKEKAQVDIQNMLNREESAHSGSKARLSVPDKIKPSTPGKKPIEYKIVRLPSPSQVVVESNPLIPNDSPEPEQLASRPSSIETSSSLATVTKQPCAPNPSPQLSSNRFQIFPTTNPNTFHAYTNSSSQPTIISMDHFCLARANLKEQGKNQNKIKPLTGASRRPGNMLGVRMHTSADNRKRQSETLKTNTLIKGQSINIKTQPKSDSDALTDIEADASDENAGKSSSEDNDDKKSLVFVPPHSASKFFKISNSSVAVKKKRRKADTPEFVTYTPFQSLVIKSCQSVNPVVVIPESESYITNEVSNTLPSRTQTVSGHLSPLKGIRILRRKMTIKHYDSDPNQCNMKVGLNSLLHDSKNLKSFSLDQDLANSDHIVETDAKINDNGYQHATTKPTKSLKSMQSLNSLYSKAGYLSEKIDQQQPNVVYHSSLNGGIKDRSYSLADETINVDKLCLRKDNAAPFLLLKEGSMQSLNFINPNAIHFSLAPISKQDAKDAADRSAKRRRKIQLGSGGGSGDCVSVKIAAGGGFKSNVARYSLLLRQKYHKHQEETAQKKIQQEEILEISKAGIEPLNKGDKRMQKLFGSNLRSESNTLPCVVEGLNEDSSVETQSNIINSQSHLHIRDLLDNLCANTEPFEDELPNDDKNGRQVVKISENKAENSKNVFALTKSPSLNDLPIHGRMSK